MKKTDGRPLHALLPVLLCVAGGVGGYLYYRFVGCATGSCAITSNPYVSTLFGGVFGYLFGVVLAPGKRQREDDPEEPNG